MYSNERDSKLIIILGIIPFSMEFYKTYHCSKGYLLSPMNNRQVQIPQITLWICHQRKVSTSSIDSFWDYSIVVSGDVHNRGTVISLVTRWFCINISCCDFAGRAADNGIITMYSSKRNGFMRNILRKGEWWETIQSEWPGRAVFR